MLRIGRYYHHKDREVWFDLTSTDPIMYRWCLDRMPHVVSKQSEISIRRVIDPRVYELDKKPWILIIFIKKLL